MKVVDRTFYSVGFTQTGAIEAEETDECLRHFLFINSVQASGESGDDASEMPGHRCWAEPGSRSAHARLLHRAGTQV